MLLQDNIAKANKLRVEKLSKNKKDIERVLYHQGLSYIPEILYFNFINYYYKNLLAGYFEIDKMHKLITRKYY